LFQTCISLFPKHKRW